LRAVIAIRGGYCWWDVDLASWVVTLHSPEEQDFFGKTLEEALARCL
jgi:predicted RNase H-like HicB family nuclease